MSRRYQVSLCCGNVLVKGCTGQRGKAEMTRGSLSHVHQLSSAAHYFQQSVRTQRINKHVPDEPELSLVISPCPFLEIISEVLLLDSA